MTPPPHDAHRPPDPDDPDHGAGAAGPTGAAGAAGAAGGRSEPGGRSERSERSEPSELTEAFRSPEVRLAPPPGAFGALRRRAAARRRRRVLAVGTGVAACLVGAAIVVSVARPGDEGPVTANPSPREPEPPAQERPTGVPENGEDERPEPTPEETPNPGTPPAPDDPDTDSGGTGDGGDQGGGGQQDDSGGTGGTGGEDGPGMAGAGAPDCAAGQLGVALAPGDAGAGSVTHVLTFTNNGAEPCAVLGFPDVTLVTGEGGEPIGSPAAPGPERIAAGRVELAPGGTAQADVRISRAENYPDADCSPTPAPGLRVQPPTDAGGGRYLPLNGITGCADPDVNLLNVTAVYGARGS